MGICLLSIDVTVLRTLMPANALLWGVPWALASAHQDSLISSLLGTQQSRTFLGRLQTGPLNFGQ